MGGAGDIVCGGADGAADTAAAREWRHIARIYLARRLACALSRHSLRYRQKTVSGRGSTAYFIVFITYFADSFIPYLQIMLYIMYVKQLK